MLNVSGGIRTPDPRLRRPLLYPTELLVQNIKRVMRIELTYAAWKAAVLPLNYTRTQQKRLYYNNHFKSSNFLNFFEKF